MSGLGLVLFLSWSVCGSLLAQTATHASTENNTSSDNMTREPTTSSPPFTKQNTPPSPTTKPTTTARSPWNNSIKDCPREVMVCGVLIVACAFFLMTTFLLTSKVCRLSRHIRMLSRGALLNSSSDFSEAKNDKSKSEGEDKEAAVLMSYVTQTNQELDSDATGQDGGKAEENGRRSEEKNEEESPTSEEASAPAAATAESSTFSQPQKEAAGSETTPAPAAATSSSEGTAEPQNQP